MSKTILILSNLCYAKALIHTYTYKTNKNIDNNVYMDKFEEKTS